MNATANLATAAAKPYKRRAVHALPHFNHRRTRPHYTYAEYAKWPEDMRCELINGDIYMMASPNYIHQKLQGWLYKVLDTFLEGKQCVAMLAPFDVRLRADPNDDEDAKDDDLVVQPDLIVVCDRNKLKDKKACRGAPDLVIEILSPSTRKLDLEIKRQEYVSAGVREYWVVDPEARTISCGILTEQPGGFYDYNWYTWKEGDAAPVGIFEGGLAVDVSKLFAAAELE
jgi:Uma2 family endonuclease